MKSIQNYLDECQSSGQTVTSLLESNLHFRKLCYREFLKALGIGHSARLNKFLLRILQLSQNEARIIEVEYLDSLKKDCTFDLDKPTYEPKKNPIINVICKTCKMSFQTNKRKQVYCSRKCRDTNLSSKGISETSKEKIKETILFFLSLQDEPISSRKIKDYVKSQLGVCEANIAKVLKHLKEKNCVVCGPKYGTYSLPK